MGKHAGFLASSVFFLILALFAVLYLLSSSVNRSLSNSIVGGDEGQYKHMIAGPLIPKDNPTDFRKHVIFPFLTVPLYRLGTFAIAPFSSNSRILFAFPFALIGLVNLLLMYRLFRLVLGDPHETLYPRLFTILCAGCFSFWLFHSSAETYAVTTLAQNLLFLYAFSNLAKTKKLNNVIIGLLVSACIMASLGAVFVLCFVACFYFFQHEKKMAAFNNFVLACLVAVSVIGCVYGALYFNGVTIFGPMEMLDFARNYTDRYTVFEISRLPKYVVRVLRAFFVDSIGYTRWGGINFANAFFLLSYAPVLVITVRALVKAKREIPDGIKAFIVLTTSYFVFHCFFGVKNPGLYAIVMFVPWMSTVFWALSRLPGHRLKLGVVTLLAVSVLLNNNLLYSAFP